ncbi:MAG TPA: MBL fold metallo-hydrolase [Methylomirabilota bacterium]|nr:MBL fold metallo-hydrolase [Methylomirabilota bacterium]
MNVTFYGVRGSLATPGPSTARYGGNTSCVRVMGPDGRVLVLDAGTGIRPLTLDLPGTITRVDVLLTHLHMDHILGLGFFGPLFNPGMEVHIWGPASATLSLEARLRRYLSPPLFPMLLRDVPCRLELHHVVRGGVPIGPFHVTTARVCHPGPTVGYRVETEGVSFAYLPDHEPALGAKRFPLEPEWTSGFDLAHGVDLLVHDAQYTQEEYPRHVGWGHSTMHDALVFARLAEVKHFVPFHHDPGRDDAALEAAVARAVADVRPEFPVTPAAEGASLKVA